MKFSTKNTIKLISTLSFMTLSIFAFSQEGENLVPNGSFEATDKKPKRLGSIAMATDWASPTGVRADLFAPGKMADIGSPDNIFGSETAKDGDNYAGVYAYSHGGKMPRSYVMTKLDSPLKKGLKYCVKFNISLAEASKYACNNMAVLLTKKPKGTDGKVSIIDEPSLMHFENETKVFSARYNWTEICGQFTAKGGEKYITLGNFLSDEETTVEKMKKEKGSDVKAQIIIAAYYYIDDISVQLLDSDKGEVCECASGDASDEYSTTIYQQKLTMGDDMTAKEKIELQQVYYAFGKKKMNSEGEASLKLIAEQMKANPAMKLQIVGHHNEMEEQVGMEDDHYAGMDNRRIGAVMKYLIENGISESRLMASPKGSQVSNEQISDLDDDDLKMAKDRRVTFIVR